MGVGGRLPQRTLGVLFALGLSGCGGVAGGPGLVGSPSPSGSTAWPFAHLIPAQLAEGDIVVAAPSTSSVAVSETQAESVAAQNPVGTIGQAPPLEASIVQFTDPHLQNGVSCTCWVLVYQPTPGMDFPGPPGAAAYHFKWWIDVIDANSGKWVEGTGGPPSTKPDLP
jgi:hypothetical protein